MRHTTAEKLTILAEEANAAHKEIENREDAIHELCSRLRQLHDTEKKLNSSRTCAREELRQGVITVGETLLEHQREYGPNWKRDWHNHGFSFSYGHARKYMSCSQVPMAYTADSIDAWARQANDELARRKERELIIQSMEEEERDAPDSHVPVMLEQAELSQTVHAHIGSLSRADAIRRKRERKERRRQKREQEAKAACDRMEQAAQAMREYIAELRPLAHEHCRAILNGLDRRDDLTPDDHMQAITAMIAMSEDTRMQKHWLSFLDALQSGWVPTFGGQSRE